MVSQQQFKNLPPEIKEWIGSDRVTYIISDINKRLDTDNPFGNEIRIIPRLILRLAVKDLRPEDFNNALQEELNLNPAKIQQAVQEIKDRVLEPIRAPLFRWGVDINKIFNSQFSISNLPPISQAPTKPTAFPPVPTRPAAPPRPLVPPPIPPRQTYEPPKPPTPPPILPKKQYPIKPAPPVPLEEVIDLSTFQRKVRPKPQSGEQPRTEGNVIDLR